MRSKNQRKDSVIRISEKNYLRVKELMDAVFHAEGKKPTLNEITEKMLDALDQVSNGEVVYLAGDKFFDDLADARGEAIMEAVKNGEVPSWPKIAIVVRSDSGL